MLSPFMIKYQSSNCLYYTLPSKNLSLHGIAQMKDHEPVTMHKEQRFQRTDTTLLNSQHWAQQVGHTKKKLDITTQSWNLVK